MFLRGRTYITRGALGRRTLIYVDAKTAAARRRYVPGIVLGVDVFFILIFSLAVFRRWNGNTMVTDRANRNTSVCRYDVLL